VIEKMGGAPLYTFEVKVHPGSSKRALEVKEDGIHVYTTYPPLEGKANRDILKIISDSLDIPKSAIELLRGEKTKNKVFSISENAIKLLRGRSKKGDQILSHRCSEILNFLKER
jgi:uncharacterized protein (TIGR00251 family)